MGMNIGSKMSQNDTMLKGIRSIGPNIVETEHWNGHQVELVQLGRVSPGQVSLGQVRLVEV